VSVSSLRTRLAGWWRSLASLWPGNRPSRAWLGPRERPAAVVDPGTLEQGLRLLEVLREEGLDPATRRFVHLGLGEAPALPLLWSLAGAPEVVLVEPERLLDADLLRRTAAALSRHASLLAERLDLETEEVVRRLRCPGDCTFFEALRQFRMQYVAPYDLLRDPLPRREADLVTARSPLEGYTRGYLKSVLARAAEGLPSHSRLCLCIDQPEHYEYTTLLEEAGFRLEKDVHQPVLKVIQPGDAAVPLDDSRLHSYLVAVPASRAQAGEEV